VNAEQYEVLRANRRRRGPRALGDPPPRGRARLESSGPARPTPLGQVVAEAADLLRRRQGAEAGWLRVVPPAWLEATRVVGIATARRDTALVAVDSASLLYELRRRQAQLERGLSRLAPGIRRLQFVPGGGGAAGAPQESD